ncbi:molybdopterin-dependent oxidoreductase [Angustibacter peucedani]
MPLPQPSSLRPPEIRSPLRDVRVTARVGRLLGIAVAICFVTGLVSHLHQHPVGWLPIPPSPTWGYRFTQGLHVATGIACVPLVLVKLFSVYPKLLEWPPVRSIPHALERLSVAVLVAAMLFEVVTGLLNIAQWYPWSFFFPAAHHAVAWVLAGSVLLHLAIKAPRISEGLRRALDDDADDRAATGLTRRGLVVGTLAAVGSVTLVTVGQTLPGFGRLAVLAPRRPDIGPQGLPVNRTATAARITTSAVDDTWRLVVDAPRPSSFSRSELEQLPQTEVELPISCVEGWSASARWGGVRLRDLLRLVGADDVRRVTVRSLEERGLYSSSDLTRAQAMHPDTLLALRVNGSDLALDHGYPVRLVAPNRPGVLQTKWLSRVEVA